MLRPDRPYHLTPNARLHYSFLNDVQARGIKVSNCNSDPAPLSLSLMNHLKQPVKSPLAGTASSLDTRRLSNSERKATVPEHADSDELCNSCQGLNILKESCCVDVVLSIVCMSSS